MRQNIVDAHKTFGLPLVGAAFNIIVKIYFGDADIVDGPAGVINRVIRDVLKANEYFLTGIIGQVNGFFNPGWAIAGRAGVAWAKGVAAVVGGVAVGGLQNCPAFTAVG